MVDSWEIYQAVKIPATAKATAPPKSVSKQTASKRQTQSHLSGDSSDIALLGRDSRGSEVGIVSVPPLFSEDTQGQLETSFLQHKAVRDRAVSVDRRASASGPRPVHMQPSRPPKPKHLGANGPESVALSSSRSDVASINKTTMQSQFEQSIYEQNAADSVKRNDASIPPCLSILKDYASSYVNAFTDKQNDMTLTDLFLVGRRVPFLELKYFLRFLHVVVTENSLSLKGSYLDTL
jgi:hypothetical protein